MKCYYIDDSMFQDSLFQKEMLHRFISLLKRNRVSFILISKVHQDNQRLQEFLQTYKNIPVIMSHRLFDIQGIKGQVYHSYASLDGFPMMHCYSGSCVEYDLKTKTCRRIYLDMFSSHHFDSSFQIIKEELDKLLKEIIEKDDVKISLN